MSLQIGWWDVALRLACALVAGTAIGLNRTAHGRVAGLRTAVLVSLTACLAMLQVNFLLAMGGRAPDSFVNLDPQLARRVVRRDDEVDQFNDDLIAELTAEMKKSPDAVEPGLTLYAATRHLERIADHATNIAEDVIYLIEGDIVKHRPEAIGRE